MKAERKNYFIFLAGILILTTLTEIIFKQPEMNFMAFAPGLMLFNTSSILGRKNSLAVNVLVLTYSVAMFFLLKAMSVQIFVLVLIWIIFINLVSFPFDKIRLYLQEKDAEILRRKHRLEDMKEEAIKTAEYECSLIEEDIKGITGLYTAVKELGLNLDLNNTSNAIHEIIKKIMKSFKVDTEYVQIALVLQKIDKKNEFFLAEQSGYDEDFIRNNEAKLIKHIISATKGGNIEYISDTSKISDKPGLNMVGSILYVPFFAENQLRGVMMISSGIPGLFSESQIENMKIIANQIAISLEKVYLYEEVQQMSITDSLTGLYVHRHFQEKLENELKRASRYDNKLSLVIGDIDYFKKINDTYGHLAGDYILKNIALTLKNFTKPIDTVARYGGEEFVIIFPDCDKEAAFVRAEKIRKEIQKQIFKFMNFEIKVTMSMGVATCPDDAIARRTLIDKADKMLYKAKQEGRNRVIKA